MGEAGNKATVEAMYGRLSAGDLRGFLERCHDDLVYTVRGTTIASVRSMGKRDFINRVLKPNAGKVDGPLVLTVDRMVAEGDLVVAELSGRARLVGGGRYDNQYCLVIEFDGPLVRAVTEYLDTELVTQAFGRRSR